MATTRPPRRWARMSSPWPSVREMMAVVAMPSPTYMPLTSCCMGTVKPSAASGSRPSWPTKALSVSWKVISESTPKSMGQVMW